MLDINLTHAKSPGRFSGVLSPRVPHGRPKLVCDTVVHRDERLVVCPTLGSFLPLWYLIIPTTEHLNFSDWEKENNLSARDQIDLFRSEALNAWKHFVWFEHGANTIDSVTGCGVDHAHIHVISNIKFGLAEMLRAAEDLGVSEWHHLEPRDSYKLRDNDSEYLVFGDAHRTYFKNLSDPVGTQFFRRVIAKVNGNRPDWDYKKFPHLENARLSVSHVTRLAQTM